jgi:hypothetical protein
VPLAKGVEMTLAVSKYLNLKKIIYTFVFCFSSTFVLFLMLFGCATSDFDVKNITWKTYNNSRYGFEFPYPSNWSSLKAPENNDGIVFVSPQNKSVEIRGWASKQLLESIIQDPKTRTNKNSNFQTAQGISGVLVVEINQKLASMTLTLTQGQVNYYWQGRSESQEFQDYYRFFYYIAQQYRILKS